MRDRRFVAQHRGGPLSREQHKVLMQWAISCAEHVLPYFAAKLDPRIENALKVAKTWVQGDASVGDARNAAFDLIKLANELPDPAAIFVTRSIAHAVSTAHMADHSLGAAWYALKAAKAVGKSVAEERQWQDAHLTEEIRMLVLSAREADKFKIK